MEISAIVRSSAVAHAVSVATDGRASSLEVPARAGGGSAVNGGEFLLLALATCYCNDLYREAGRMGLELTDVEVEAMAEFPGVGMAAENVRYRAKVSSPAPAGAIAELLRQTDAVAEVHNTLRSATAVTLVAQASVAEGPEWCD